MNPQPGDLSDAEWAEFLDLSCLIRRVHTGRRDLRPLRADTPRLWRSGLFSRGPLLTLGRVSG